MPDRYFQIGYSEYITSQPTNCLSNTFHGGSYRVYNIPPLGPTQSPTNLIHTVLQLGRTDGGVYFCWPRHHSYTWFRVPQDSWPYITSPTTWRSVLNLPSTPRSSKWPLSFSISGHIFLCSAYAPHAGYMRRPYHPPSFDHPNNIWWGTQIEKLHITQVPPAYCCRFLLGPSILTSTLFWRILKH
jgi:hypothetical protein